MGRIHAFAVFAAGLLGTCLFGTQVAEADPACTCRGPGGVRVELGGTLCLPTPVGPRLARCVMDVNILSWQTLDAPCTVSLGPPTTPWRRLAAMSATPRVVPTAP